MNVRPARTAVIVMLTAMSMPAPAQTVYNGSSPNGGVGWNIFNGTRAADDFWLAAPLRFNAIRFWGILPAGTAYVPHIFWEFLVDQSGLPGTGHGLSGLAAATARLRGASAFPGFNSWQFDLVLMDHTLSPGLYWLALHDGAPSDVTFSDLIWETSGGGQGTSFAVEDLGIWTGGWDGNLAFELRLDVAPEPGAIWLLGTGLIGLGCFARRHRHGKRFRLTFPSETP